jgi:hypothetical protein
LWRGVPRADRKTYPVVRDPMKVVRASAREEWNYTIIVKTSSGAVSHNISFGLTVN